MTEPLTPADESRIQQLVTVFRRIGEERMKDLGLYNPDLQVEAVGFRRWEGWLAGVLVTVPVPVSLLLTAKTKEPMDCPLRTSRTAP